MSWLSIRVLSADIPDWGDLRLSGHEFVTGGLDGVDIGPDSQTIAGLFNIYYARPAKRSRLPAGGEIIIGRNPKDGRKFFNKF